MSCGGGSVTATGSTDEIIDIAEVVSRITPADELDDATVVDVEADEEAGTLPKVETNTLIRVIRNTPKIDKLLILSAEANPLRLCTL